MLDPIVHRISLFLVCLFLLLFSQSVYALKFEPYVPDKSNPARKVLLIRDCDVSVKDDCQEENEKRFSFGDAEILRAFLSTDRFAEIWIYSGGGDLEEGVKIGRLLREKRQFVRVPYGKRCISACTVAYLGGFLRTIDPGASYEMHAYSSLSRGVSSQFIHNMDNNPEQTLREWALEEAREGREWAGKLMVYFQEMLNGQPNRAAIKAATVGKITQSLPYFYDGRLQQDVARFKIARELALQEIAMKIERESMAIAIEDLKAVQDTLGKRAPDAIKILEIKFTSRITDTAKLNRSTLREMGFINVRFR